uniref:Uncharacterized protein n=1 Tax=Timema shepardi TaxID=629360 RepID=A0A7R9B2Z1_TIMSH|nr:unnamed protein product [Timema shepardi]
MSFDTESYMQLCRLCASYQAIKMEIYGKEGTGRNLVEKIEICLPFKVCQDDHLPKSLCYRCMYLLENFYDFRKNCVNSVSLLESCLTDPDGLEVNPELRLEYERLQSQLREVKCRNKKGEVGETDNSMPRLEPQVPVPNVVDRNGRRPSGEPAKQQAHPSVPVMDDSGDYHEEGRSWDVPTLKRSSKKPTSLLSCPYCTKAFYSQGRLSLHIKCHNGEEVPGAGANTAGKRPFSCDLCHRSYTLSKHLWGHMNSAHKGDPAVTCPVCGRVCSTCANLEEHKRSKHGLEDGEVVESTYTDNAEAKEPLERAFKSESELRVKRQERAGGGKTQGGEVSLLKQTLLKSRKRAANRDGEEIDVEAAKKHAPEAVPPDSNPGNRRKSSKPRKIARCESGEEEEEYTCEVCFDTFPSSEHLVEHGAVHCGYEEEASETSGDRDKPFTCLLCDKSFSVRQALSRHFHACHGIDPSDVDVFGSTSDPLHKQMFVPSAEDMMEMETGIVGGGAEVNSGQDASGKQFFSCEVCIREFHDRGSLWLHMLHAHRDQAGYACGVCLKICGNNDHLGAHWRQHVGGADNRRYVCTVCGRQHDTRKKLVHHVGIHALENGEGGFFDPESFVVQNQAFYSSEHKEKDGGVVSDYGASSGSDRWALESPTQTHADNYSCEICYKSFPSEEGLVKHKRNAHKEELAGGGTLPRGSYQLFFVCELCGSSHGSKSERWRHVYQTHCGQATLTCDRPTCGKVFTTQALRTEHCASHHQKQGAVPNTCEVCGKLWGSRVDFWKHMMGVHPDLVALTCGVCLKVLCDLVELKTHVRATHWPLTNEFSCDLCGRPYSNKSKMSRHRKIHGDDSQDPRILENTNSSKKHLYLSGAKNPDLMKKSILKIPDPSAVGLSLDPKRLLHPTLWCETCPHLHFTTVAQLGHHRRTVHNLYPCDLCTKFYSRTTHLLYHVVKAHSNHPELRCSVCSKMCRSKSAVAAHIAAKHFPREAKKQNHQPSFKSAATKKPSTQTCSLCSKTFWKRSVYRRHYKACRAKNAFKPAPEALVCEVCPDIAPTTKTELMTHIREHHAGHPSFCCPVEGCGRMVRSRSDLELHQKMHDEGKPHATCDLCGNVYNHESRARKHMFLYHKRAELAGLCGVCLKNLPDMERLKEHVVAEHPGNLEAPFTCQVCAKTLSNNSKVCQHVLTCHPSVVACRTCLQVFPDRSDLQTHRKEVHDCYDMVREDQTTDNVKDEMEKKQEVAPLKEGESPPKRSRRSYECDSCGEQLTSPSLLSDHKKRSHSLQVNETKPYHCGVCDKNFSNKTSYWKHINSPIHLNTKMIKSASSNSARGISPIDNKIPLVVLPNLGELDLKLEASPAKTTRPESKKGYDSSGPCFCSVCGKQWPAKRHLWQHLIRYHQREAAVTCGVCLAVCADYPDLSRHLAQHQSSAHRPREGTNNFVCQTCGRYHNARTKLQQHATIHVVLGPGPEGQPPSLGDLRATCDTCLESFPDMEALGFHQRTQHCGDTDILTPKMEMTMLFDCVECGLAFSSERDLNTHEGTHRSLQGSFNFNDEDDDEAFPCGKCGEVFDDSDALIEHIQGAHGKVFACRRCGDKSFSTYLNLTKHYRVCKSKVGRNLKDRTLRPAEDPSNMAPLDENMESLLIKEELMETDTGSDPLDEAEDSPLSSSGIQVRRDFTCLMDETGTITSPLQTENCESLPNGDLGDLSESELDESNENSITKHEPNEEPFQGGPESVGRSTEDLADTPGADISNGSTDSCGLVPGTSTKLQTLVEEQMDALGTNKLNHGGNSWGIDNEDCVGTDIDERTTSRGDQLSAEATSDEYLNSLDNALDILEAQNV